MIRTLMVLCSLFVFAGPVLADAAADAAPPKARAGAGSKKSGTTSPNVYAQSEMNAAASELVRIKDIADVQGVRGNQLVGYGLVVGLEGTGDGQSALFTPSTITNMLRKFGVNIDVNQVRVKNVAAVMVTADLPPFVKPGSRIDVTVSSLGDAKSLQGGTLIQTPLRAASGDIYAVAQGALSIGGFNFEAGGSKVQKNFVNVGRIPRGAYVEQEVPATLTDGSTMQITLREPDFTTANRAAAAIRRQLGVNAIALDAATVSVSIPANAVDDAIAFISRVETVRVTPDTQARIVINERTGTVVMGGSVKLAPGAVAHGAINIQVTNTPVVVPAPPNSINAPPPVVVPFKQTDVAEGNQGLAALPATSTIDQMVRALNHLGVTPRDLISILQGMKAAGMIQAEIEIQ